MSYALAWTPDGVRYLDQTALPHREVWRTAKTTPALCLAIERLAIRGAPALGIAGAYGVAHAATRSRARNDDAVLKHAGEAGAALAATRPTAVNLAWAIRRVLDAGRVALARSENVREAITAEARAIAAEDADGCIAIARAGMKLIPKNARVLTHCNTGALCTGGEGTALAIIKAAHRGGRVAKVLVMETRPLLQGARLTAWELGKAGISHALIPDSAGPALISRGELDLVVTGADRIAANGDVANKIGTYALALAAHAAGIPFIVAAPVSTIDRTIASGDEIVVEHRKPEEVTMFAGVQVAPFGTEAINPAFDVTPARLVTAIVTDHGVVRTPFRSGLLQLFRTRPRQNPVKGRGGVRERK